MRTIYHVQADDLQDVLSEDELEQMYETEGMFDEEGNTLGIWTQNDARWRSEYFDGFMEKLDVEVYACPDNHGLKSKIAQAFVERFGY